VAGATRSKADVHYELILDPGSAQEIRDRGLLYMNLECFLPGGRRLRNLSQAPPDRPDTDDIRRYLDAVRKQIPVLH
jgi:regulator of sirC expression with transglutaminase-like and TPR domain